MGQIDYYISMIGQIYLYMIIVYVLLSWVPNARESFVGNLLAKLVEPYLSPFRKFIPPIGGMLDISPVVALFVLQFVIQGIIAVVHFIIPG
ncbi:YggT family protein [Paenibacillus terrigena]|uniref:YggT family protein n=1 Tax=Paenibacillus terrigena TaxID=369333 RepID=UPI0028D2976A|nr:YggT family protein [Paenibacillus terrigena]